MSLWKRMNEITSGKSEEEKATEEIKDVAKPGDIIKGVITNVVMTTPKKKGGYGFITSPDLPYERIFFHWSGLSQDTLRFPALKKRMKVEFTLQIDEDNQGYRAIKIKVLD
jgi:cold shock CspA family protein